MKLTTWGLALVCIVSAACTTSAGSLLGGLDKANGASATAASTDGDAGLTQYESDQKVTTTTGLPCDVDGVLKANCETCHASTPQFGASTSLVTWDDLQKDAPAAYPGKKVWEVVQERIHDDTRPMPAPPGNKLAGADLAAMDAWFAAQTPKSDATCTNNAPADAITALSCTPDVTFKAPVPFTMPANANTDTYMCYGVDINLATKRHVTAFAPNVDNKKIVHHMILFQAPTSQSTTPFECSAFGATSWKFVAGWAPGGGNLELPPEAGFPEEVGTTHWVMQIHYNDASNATGAQDSSGYSMCTTETLRANDAGIVAFGSTKFVVPPRASATVKCDYPLDPRFNGVHMFNALPHMHTHGVSIATTRLAGGGGDELPVFSQDNFSFEAQGNYPIDVDVKSGDLIRTRCNWKNPGDTALTFGEGTGDEMCFDFVAYYPAIPDVAVGGFSAWGWATPSDAADCSMEQ